MALLTENKIIDYISGIEVNATPEEVEAVQVFSRQLVEDYGYKKEQIQTRPQFRVKVRPSDTKKEYPVDIAVFKNKDKKEDDVYNGTTGILCEDSLENPIHWKAETQLKIQLYTFDILITNPPFGSKIPVSGEEKLKQYELAHQWKKSKENDGGWDKYKIKDKEAPQILFIERCFQLLKDGGKMAIVLPEGTFGNTDLGYIRKFILDRARLIAVIDVPLETFMPNTGTKTSILIVQKLSNEKIPSDYPVFMAIAETCGHDRRGNEMEGDDIKDMAEQFNKWKNEVDFKF